MIMRTDNLMISLYVSCILIFWFYVTEIMKKSKIISSEMDSSVNVKQKQNTDIDFLIRPPSVNFQPCAMADLATMAPPGAQKPSTFAPPTDRSVTARPVAKKREAPPPLIGLRRQGSMNGHGNSILTGNPTLPEMKQQPQNSMSQPVVGALLQTLGQQINKAFTSHEQEDKEVAPVVEQSKQVETTPKPEPVYEQVAPEAIQKPVQKQDMHPLVGHAQKQEILAEPAQKLDMIVNGPYIEKPNTVTVNTMPIDMKPVVNTATEAKKPEPNKVTEKLIPSKKNEEHERMLRLLQEKTREVAVLEALLEIYKNKHKINNGLLVCHYNQLIQLVKAQCAADKVEIITNEEGGCTIKKHGVIDIESIIVEVNGKSYDFRYGFPEQYATLVRHGVDMKKVLE